MLLYWVCPALCFFVCLPLLYRLKKRSKALSITFKTLGTCCALVLALYGVFTGRGANWLCAAALAFGTAADAMLEIRFFPGMMLFALGHVCSCIWFVCLCPPSGVHAWAVLALLAVAAGLLFAWRRLLGKLMLPFAGYAAMLCLMAGLAVGTGWTLGNIGGLLLALGGLLFLVSDIMVARGLIKRMSLRFDCIAMIVYDSAQLLLAAACTLI